MIQEYYTPSTIVEAVSLKRQFGERTAYYAGGTHLNYPPTENSATKAIGLSGLGLHKIDRDAEAVVIESGVTLQRIIDSEEAPKPLKEACGMVITRNLRNMATIGGNIAANRSDSPIVPYLIACQAQIVLDDQRAVPIEEYIAGDNEGLILKVRLPISAGRFSVKRVTHSANGLPILTVAVKIEKKGTRINTAIVVVGGLEERARRLGEIERELLAGRFSETEEMERQVADLLQPTDDFLGSGEYKRYICGITVGDCIRECLEGGEAL